MRLHWYRNEACHYRSDALNEQDHRFSGLSHLSMLALCLLASLASPAMLHASGPLNDGTFVTVRGFSSRETERIKEVTQDAITRFRAREPAGGGVRRGYFLIIDFNPENHSSASDDYGACYQLAKYLRSLRQEGVTTVAFVHRSVTRHAVLPVLACQELVMSEEARLGDVHGTEYEQNYYRELIAEHYPRNQAVAWRMFDKALRVRKVRRLDENIPFYVDAEAIRQHSNATFQPAPAIAALGTLAGVPLRPRELPAGIIALTMNGQTQNVQLMDREAVDPGEPGTTTYTAARAKEFGLCNHLAESTEDVKELYQLPPASLREDPLLGRYPNAWRIDISGSVNRAAVESIKRRVRRAIGKGANLVILQLDCGGGDLSDAIGLADWLRALKDDRGELSITTIAYVPHHAPDTAFVLALGCSQIVLHDGAEIGNLKHFLDPDAQRNEMVAVKPLRALAHSQGYSEQLIQGMLDRSVTLYSVVGVQGDQPRWKIITRDEMDPQKWKLDEHGEIKREGDLLVLKANDARDLGLARHVIRGDPGDISPLYHIFGLEPREVQVDRGDWLDGVQEFLRHPVCAIFLVMIGVIGLILEMKIPGATMPGIVAAVCFILFFWAHSALAGQWTWLAILLFVLGLILLGLEVFVIPGFGAAGISGILLVIVSLGLVTLERKPETTREWVSFGATLTTFGLSIIGAVAGALILAWYLPHIPFFNRLILKPMGEDGDGDGMAVPPSGVDYTSLLGAIGVAATPLRPSGKAQFGEEFLDVLAEASYVAPGSRVQVIEIEGNRIVVKEV